MVSDKDFLIQEMAKLLSEFGYKLPRPERYTFPKIARQIEQGHFKAAANAIAEAIAENRK